MGGRQTLTVEPRYAGSHPGSVYVVRNSTGVIFADSCFHSPATDAVWAFYSENGHWVLEMVDRVIVDGVNLNQLHEFNETFHYRLLGEEHVCLARTGNQYGISVDGEFLPNHYDLIVHHKCCEPSFLNPYDIEGGFYFLARREDVPLLVEVIADE
jgi:hypothetical protein